MNYSLEKLIGKEEIAEKVKELGEQITRDYHDKDTIFVGILKGSFIFLADLARAVDIEKLEISFMMVSSYGSGTKSSGNITIKKDLETDLKGKHVLIVEDIVDSGNTLSYLKKYLSNREAASVKICTILDKPSRRYPHLRATIVPDYIGFSIEDYFVVGWGLDYNEDYRLLPDIMIYHPDAET